MSLSRGCTVSPNITHIHTCAKYHNPEDINIDTYLCSICALREIEVVVPKKIIVRDIERMTLRGVLRSGVDHAVSPPGFLRCEHREYSLISWATAAVFFSLKQEDLGQGRVGSAAPPLTDKARWVDGYSITCTVTVWRAQRYGKHLRSYCLSAKDRAARIIT